MHADLSTLLDSGPLAIAAVAVWQFGRLVAAITRASDALREWLDSETRAREAALAHYQRVAVHLQAEEEHQAQVVHLLASARGAAQA